MRAPSNFARDPDRDPFLTEQLRNGRKYLTQIAAAVGALRVASRFARRAGFMSSTSSTS